MRSADANRFRRIMPFGLLLVLALACDQPTQLQEGSAKTKTAPKSGGTGRAKSSGPPKVTAEIANVKVRIDGDVRMQTFDLTLHNHGDKPETVHGLVYARNDKLNPRRRAISPATAKDWFKLAGSKDGSLTAADVERVWKGSGFVSGRGGTLRRTWGGKAIEPGDSLVEEAAHDLDMVGDVELNAPVKGKKTTIPLGKANAYTEYQVWLFTADGSCFAQDTWQLTPSGANNWVAKKSQPVVEPPPEPKKTETSLPDPPRVTDPRPPETKPAPRVLNPKMEAQAENELRLAKYYLDQNRQQDARDKLNLILRRYPGTEAARKAEEMLKGLSKTTAASQ